MGRPIYAYELDDPDFSWLLARYRENHPDCQPVELTCLPVVLIQGEASEEKFEMSPSLPEQQPGEAEDVKR